MASLRSGQLLGFFSLFFLFPFFKLSPLVHLPDYVFRENSPEGGQFGHEQQGVSPPGTTAKAVSE